MNKPGNPGNDGPQNRRHADACTRRLALIRTLSLLSVGISASAVARPATHTVIIEALAYKPAALTVKRGDVVVWTNKDPYPHTVTAQGVFDSKSIAPGGTWKYTANKTGDFPYTCTFHPNMKGTLRVE